MKKVIFTIIWVSFMTPSVFGQNILKFKISRSYCVLNFLQASKGANGTSKTLKRYIEKNIEPEDTAFSKLIAEYATVNLDMNFRREGFPENRHSDRSTFDLICIAAVQSNTLEEFSNRTVGVLSNSDHIRFFDIMTKADAYYEKIIWSKYGEQAKSQIQALEKYLPKANQAFMQLKRFYNASWADNMPFTVAIVPVPGKKGNTSATPHANSLCVDVLTEETRREERIAVVMHEIGHVLYDEQNRTVQHQLYSCFAKNTSKYRDVAQNFFDEGLATACGNGWTYQFLTGKMDTTAWYDNEYIDGFGQVLYPMVKNYIEKNHAIDSNFVAEAIRLFGEKFPMAAVEIGIKMNRIALFADFETDVERGQLQNAMRNHFIVTAFNMSTPILDPISLDMIKQNPDTKVFVIDRDVEKTLNSLKTILPDLGKVNYNVQDDFIINFLDSENHLVIILKTSLSKLDMAFKRLNEQQYVKQEEVYIKL